MNVQLIKYIGRGIAVLLLLMLVSGYYLFTQVCANTVLSEALSPGKAWKVVLFERSCGSMTGFSTQVSLMAPDQALQNDTGNVYVAEGYPEGYKVEWLSDSSLKVSGVKGTSHLKLKEFEGVEVLYEEAVSREK